MSDQHQPNNQDILSRDFWNLIIQNREISQDSRDFLEDEANQNAFSKCIYDSCSRDQFLAIESITEEIYKNLRKALNGYKVNDDISIVAIRGRAGGLKLLEIEKLNSPAVTDEQINKFESEAEEIDDKEKVLEKDFYPMVRAWALEAGYKSCEISGDKKKGHSWENPDLISVDYSFNKIFRSIDFDVASFEVKLKIKPSAIWQAAHYLKFSNEVYVAFAKSSKEIKEKDKERVFSLAVELGLGVLAYENNKFTEIQSPRRNKPDQEMVAEFVDNFSSLDSVGQAVKRATEDLDRSTIEMVRNHLNKQ